MVPFTGCMLLGEKLYRNPTTKVPDDGLPRALGAIRPMRIVSIIGLEFAVVEDWGDYVPNQVSTGLGSSRYC